MAWYNKIGDEGDVVLASVLTLKRNLKDYPFPSQLDKESEYEISKKVSLALDGLGFDFFESSSLTSVECGALCEKKYMSENASFLFLSKDEGVSISVCAENHIEIKVALQGLSLARAEELLFFYDSLFDKKLTYAFDEKYGYITTSPKDLGCGENLSVTLFLPAHEECKKISEIASFARADGLVLSGGPYIYEIKTAKTLGYTEKELLLSLSKLVYKIITRERDLRFELYDDSLLTIENRIMCSYGKALHAILLSEDELTLIFADLRLGIILGIGGYNISYETLGEMYVNTLPFALKAAYKGEDNSDRARAKCVRDLISIGR